ncbi:hypothetical protein ABZ614_14225 [Streptomyces sp. NPDC013178]|uniref:hypothetical protein n=1 Tax=unclassified Streptomyces TaxID=2593676 RepID=UPI0033E0C814
MSLSPSPPSPLALPPPSESPSASTSASASSSLSASRPPGTDAPATREVPLFAPVRVRGGRFRLRRLVRSRRRALALGLAVTAAVLVAAGPGDAGPSRGHSDGGVHARAQAPTGDPVRRRPAAEANEAVEAPVRIADAAAVRLLRPGDRVDVIAADRSAAGGAARVIARRALVTKVPEPLDGVVGAADPTGGEVVDGGALVVVSVSPSTAARLAGASATAQLAVTLW